MVAEAQGSVRKGRRIVSGLIRKTVTVYSDFTNGFDVNPFTGSLAKVTNEDSVRQALRNILLTGNGERFYNSNKGSRIRNSLFEPYDPVNLELLRDSIKESCRWEPRAVIKSVNIGPIVSVEQNGYETLNPQHTLDLGGYSVNIVFSIINIPNQTFDLSVNIQRVR